MSGLSRGSRHSPKGSHREISLAPQAHDQHPKSWETLDQTRRGLDSIFRLKAEGTPARSSQRGDKMPAGKTSTKRLAEAFPLSSCHLSVQVITVRISIEPRTV